MGSGGQIRQRESGLWEGRSTVPTIGGMVYGKTKREAQEKMRAALLAADHGIKPVRIRLTVSDYLANWLDARGGT